MTASISLRFIIRLLSPEASCHVRAERRSDEKIGISSRHDRQNPKNRQSRPSGSGSLQSELSKTLS
jgi:hypothetical protein